MTITAMPKHTWTYSGQVLADGLSVNLSDFFTRLIKDAARCNLFSSDVIYDINDINEALNKYAYTGEFTERLIGFRKNGVDGRQFIECRCDGDSYKLYNHYFALYSVNVVPDSEYTGFANIVVTEYCV